MSPSQSSSCSGLRQFTVGNAPITPLRQAATTRSTPETRNIGAAISGRLRRSGKRASGSAVLKFNILFGAAFVVPRPDFIMLAFGNIGTTEGPRQSKRQNKRPNYPGGKYVRSALCPSDRLR